MTPFLIHKSCRVFPSFCPAFSEVLFETANEFTHRFMIAEAVAKGVITADGAKALRGRFQQIPALTEYWRHTERMLALNLLFAPVNEVIIRTAQAVRQEADSSLTIRCWSRRCASAACLTWRATIRISNAFRVSRFLSPSIFHSQALRL